MSDIPAKMGSIMNKKPNKKELKAKTDQLIKAALQKKKKKELYEAKEWYTIRSLLGNQWSTWYFCIGARQRGKTFAVQDFVLNCFFNPKSKLYHVPFY